VAGLRGLNRTIPRPLEAICLKALAAGPADRYQSVAGLARDIRQFTAQLPIQAYPEGLIGMTRRLASKYRAFLALILTYMVVRIIIFFWLRL
jgi:hypothetical protein